ncbi:nucleotidyl transferase AbiEii/AbiGii toxin family protein [Vibrio sp. DW001]|uniref:nucleotidyl transferase AbiEii/AbiGii toxin family protein n=1 Tax=Vibrio sp. DW001 TaxID=2912315 RepID=UPI0023B06095|nr:nucleotidyl transferase AbiEii/AbiGii toxin family protein [Vibrio sp. DW001]WED29056.1 nucleotidyl transferase AbiEii/AbiGii toxin family protein [Vibrio sp. DW001]
MVYSCQQAIDMAKYKIPHHQIIESALENFNADFFCENNILFGGGTRIALELDEYRESIDIDFLCPNKASYRAIREHVTNISLGELVKKEFTYAREIRADRDAVRTFITLNGTNIKLEFLSCDDYDLTYEYDTNRFPVPFLDQTSCFYTKLLANSDRKFTAPYKDIFDILAMYKEWGHIPQAAFKLAGNHYGETTIINDLIISLEDIVSNKDKYSNAAKTVKMKDVWSNAIIEEYAFKLLDHLK